MSERTGAQRKFSTNRSSSSRRDRTSRGEASAVTSFRRSPQHNPSASRYVGNQNDKISNDDRMMDDRASPIERALLPVDGDKLEVLDVVTLRKSENAWRPRCLQKQAECDDSVKQTNDVLRMLRSVLNKLTPNNFNVLIEQVKLFEINTDDRIDGCIKMLFNKAITEPNFAHMYAQMCSALGTTNGQRPNFKRKLITQCQLEFEKHHTESKRNDSAMANTKNEAEDQVDGKDDIQYALEDKQSKIRKRAFGTVRFIGELFKQEQLTCKIMYSCINILMGEDMLDEEALECLCKLLTTIGERMEKDPAHGPQGMKPCFIRLQQIVDRKSKLRVCNRVRFMILDLIEQRSNNWKPRRIQAAPKTMGEIEEEVEKEEHLNRILNYALPEQGRGGHSRQGGDRNHGWDGAVGTSRNPPRFARNDSFKKPPPTSLPPTFDIKKLNLSDKLSGTTRLGSADMFKNWGSASTSPPPTDVQPQRTSPPNYFGSGNSGGSRGFRGSCGNSTSASGGNKRFDDGEDGNQRQLYRGRNSSRFR